MRIQELFVVFADMGHRSTKTVVASGKSMLDFSQAKYRKARNFAGSNFYDFSSDPQN